MSCCAGAAAKKELSDKRQEQLEEAKSTGNDAFKNGNYQEAIKQYTIGIDISGKKSPASCVLFSNRALCHIKVCLSLSLGCPAPMGCFMTWEPLRLAVLRLWPGLATI